MSSEGGGGGVVHAQQTQNICITFVQRRTNIVQMLYKCSVFAGWWLILAHGLIGIFKNFAIVDLKMTSSGQKMAFEGFQFFSNLMIL